uniref:Uncharacterized protein n=1 Tax=Oryza barthii TaxID=65489 RepID=A0A0D3G8M6_9ORYZ
MGELSLNVVTLSLLVMFMGAELVMLCPTCRLSMTTIAEHADLPVVGIALRPVTSLFHCCYFTHEGPAPGAESFSSLARPRRRLDAGLQR